MALVEQNQPSTGGFTTSSKTLADGWRRLGRIATFVALLGAPSVFLWAYIAKDWGVLWSVLFTIGAVAVVRGLIDVILRKFVPWPTLYGDDSEKRREADALDRNLPRRLQTFVALYGSWIESVRAHSETSAERKTLRRAIRVLAAGALLTVHLPLTVVAEEAIARRSAASGAMVITAPRALGGEEVDAACLRPAVARRNADDGGGTRAARAAAVVAADGEGLPPLV